MTAAEYAAMADPEKNRNFTRGRDWPPPAERKRRPGQGAAHLESVSDSDRSYSPIGAAEQARRAAEQLFASAPRGAA